MRLDEEAEELRLDEEIDELEEVDIDSMLFSPKGWPKEVRCLKCGKKFISPGPGYRLCPKCRRQWEYGEPVHEPRARARVSRSDIDRAIDRLLNEPMEEE